MYSFKRLFKTSKNVYRIDSHTFLISISTLIWKKICVCKQWFKDTIPQLKYWCRNKQMYCKRSVKIQLLRDIASNYIYISYLLDSIQWWQQVINIHKITFKNWVGYGCYCGLRNQTLDDRDWPPKLKNYCNSYMWLYILWNYHFL